MKAFLAAGTFLMLAACELPAKFDELTKILGGETQGDQVSADARPPQDEIGSTGTAAGRAKPAETKSKRESIRMAQKLLAGLGYQPGPLDGLDGPKTRSAVRKYQAKVGLATDGRITEALVKRLSKAGDKKKATRAGRAKLVSKAMPVYEAGDTFTYSDGRIETVTKVDGDKVHWRSNDGALFTTYRNFVLPVIERETDQVSETTTLDVGPDALWPLEVGREVSFTAKTEVTHSAPTSPRYAYTLRWHCLVEASETVSVAAGTFDALRVVCRTSTPSTQGLSERVWYYAPRIRQYVRRDEKYETAGSEESVELVAIQLVDKSWPPAARAGLGWALQQALESKSDRQSIEWGSSGVDVKVTIRPTAALSNDGSPYCRTFEQTVRGAGGPRIYPGKACRNLSGQWVVPGLEDLTQAAKTKS